MSMLLTGGEVLSLAVQIEKSGHAFYSTVALDSSDPALVELFSFLAAEEDRHLRHFEAVRAELGDFAIDGDDWEETSRYIKATTDGRFFLGEDRAIRAAHAVRDAREALDIAVGFEKDTLLFFHELLAVTPARTQESAERIIEEEKRHVLMLSQKRQALDR